MNLFTPTQVPVTPIALRAPLPFPLGTEEWVQVFSLQRNMDLCQPCVLLRHLGNIATCSPDNCQLQSEKGRSGPNVTSKKWQKCRQRAPLLLQVSKMKFQCLKQKVIRQVWGHMLVSPALRSVAQFGGQPRLHCELKSNLGYTRRRRKKRRKGS